MAEITIKQDGRYDNGNSSFPKLKLSKEAIAEMRNSVQFDNERIRGFNKSGLMQKELNLKQQLFLYEKIAGTSIRLLDENEKLIASSTIGVNEWKDNGYVIIQDHRPLPMNDCKSYPDATCWVYGNF